MKKKIAIVVEVEDDAEEPRTWGEISEIVKGVLIDAAWHTEELTLVRVGDL